MKDLFKFPVSILRSMDTIIGGELILDKIGGYGGAVTVSAIPCDWSREQMTYTKSRGIRGDRCSTGPSSNLPSCHHRYCNRNQAVAIKLKGDVLQYARLKGSHICLQLEGGPTNRGVAIFTNEFNPPLAPKLQLMIASGPRPPLAYNKTKESASNPAADKEVAEIRAAETKIRIDLVKKETKLILDKKKKPLATKLAHIKVELKKAVAEAKKNSDQGKLTNEGKSCMGSCKAAGPCIRYCGTGYCCKHGDKTNGCPGNSGSRTKHVCVKTPKSKAETKQKFEDGVASKRKKFSDSQKKQAKQAVIKSKLAGEAKDDLTKRLEKELKLSVAKKEIDFIKEVKEELKAKKTTNQGELEVLAKLAGINAAAKVKATQAQQLAAELTQAEKESVGKEVKRKLPFEIAAYMKKRAGKTTKKNGSGKGSGKQPAKKKASGSKNKQAEELKDANFVSLDATDVSPLYL